MANGDSSGVPRKWWQRLFMYPTLITALIGSIPTAQRFYQSWQIQVPTSEVDHAVAQDDFWRRNLDCLAGKNYEPVTTSGDVRVSALVCPSGDVLVRVKPPDPKTGEVAKWIGLKEFVGRSRGAWLFGSEAMAAEAHPKTVIAQAGRTVICQRWIANGLLRMRVRYDTGQCADEDINTYTGVVVKTVPAPCDTTC
jgi:hypothetical protein